MYIFDETVTKAFLLDSSSIHQLGILYLICYKTSNNSKTHETDDTDDTKKLLIAQKKKLL